MLLSKGFEIEIYTGTPKGQIIGLSDQIIQNLNGFINEPDNRNVEYTTPPRYSYSELLCDLIIPRKKLRTYLSSLGDYTLIPGSTLSLAGSDQFYRSEPNNPYHDYIEKTYGTKVVTASVHINIGISHPETLMRACRLIRAEAPLYLALSAASPFLDNQVTGWHSTRWGLFPKTPAQVPLFINHNHFIDWTIEQLNLGTMQNVRHLWLSVRPNGVRRPYELNRLELRICDLIIDPIALLAVCALLEARLIQVLNDDSLDPLIQSNLSQEELLEIIDQNEIAAARYSLNAQVHHWKNGQPIEINEWIDQIYQEVFPIAKQNNFSCFLSPIQKILREGNQALQWLTLHNLGFSPQQILIQAIKTALEQEQQLEAQLCQFKT